MIKEMQSEIQLGIITLIVVLVALWMFFNYYPLPKLIQNPKKAHVDKTLSKMKRLWTEHSYLTRMSNVEDLTGYSGSSITNEQLLANSQHLGRNLAKLYDQNIGDSLSAILLEYNQLIFDLLRQARQHKDVSSPYAALQAKGQQLKDFFLKICPCLEASRLEELILIQLDAFMKNIIYTIRDENIASMTAFTSYKKATNDLVDYLDQCIWSHLMDSHPRYL